MAASVPTKGSLLCLFFRNTLCGLHSFCTPFRAPYPHPVILPCGKVPVRNVTSNVLCRVVSITAQPHHSVCICFFQSFSSRYVSLPNNDNNCQKLFCIIYTTTHVLALMYVYTACSFVHLSWFFWLWVRSTTNVNKWNPVTWTELTLSRGVPLNFLSIYTFNLGFRTSTEVTERTQHILFPYKKCQTIAHFEIL
jgi:hypothetical protein